MSKRTFAIGDIHGCRRALDVLCESLELTSEDTLVLLGDVVDRGPNSKGAIDSLLEVQKSCQLIFIMGNHEEMMLDAFDSKTIFHQWLGVGGRETMDSYDKKMSNVPETHQVFLNSTVEYFESETEIFIHANLEPGVSLESQQAQWLRWEHLTGMEYPHESGRRVVCGHTQQKSGRPLIGNGWVCLDTGAYRGNPLACLQLDNDMVHRANESGKLYPPQPLLDISVLR